MEKEPPQNKRGNPNKIPNNESRREESQKLIRMCAIAPLFKKGYTYREIRSKLMQDLGLKTYSLSTVKHDVEALLLEWKKERIEDTDLAVQLELARIDDLVKEAWGAWEKSKEEYKATRTKATGTPSMNGGENKQRINKIEQTTDDVRALGDPRFIDTINKLLIERRKLLGLYAPEKKEVATDLSFADFLMKTGQKKE